MPRKFVPFGIFSVVLIAFMTQNTTEDIVQAEINLNNEISAKFNTAEVKSCIYKLMSQIFTYIQDFGCQTYYWINSTTLTTSSVKTQH